MARPTATMTATRSSHASTPDVQPVVTASRISVDIGFKLKGLSNYTSWSIRVKILLSSLGCWDNDTDQPFESSIAHNAILHNTDENTLQVLLDKTNAIECWDALKDKYRGDSTAAKMKSMQELVAFRFNSCTDSEFAAFKEISRNFLAAFNKPIEPANFITMIAMAHLPQKLNSVRIHMQSRSNLTFEDMEKEIASEVALTRSSSALVASSRKCQHNRDEPTCWTCHPEKRPKNKNNNPKHRRGSQQGTSSSSSSANNKIKQKQRHALLLISEVKENQPMTSTWIIDSGASEHVTCDPTLLSRVNNNNSTSLTVATGENLIVNSIGEIDAKFENTELVLKGVLASSSISYNLISVAKLTEKGLTVKFTNGTCTITKDGALLLRAKRQDGLFKVTLQH